MPPEYAGVHFCSSPSVTVRVVSAESAGAGRARYGAAPHGLKDAFGAAARSASGSLTPGPLRPLPPGTAVRPVACPAQRPPRDRAAATRSSTFAARSGPSGIADSPRGFTRSGAAAWSLGGLRPARGAWLGGWWSP
jgi:hypothetical protein